MTKADAYYTREKTAKASQICLMQYFGNRLKDFTIVGPTAGKGAMTNGMDRNVFEIHLFDLHPHEYVKQCSYLDLEVNARRAHYHLRKPSVRTIPRCAILQHHG